MGYAHHQLRHAAPHGLASCTDASCARVPAIAPQVPLTKVWVPSTLLHPVPFSAVAPTSHTPHLSGCGVLHEAGQRGRLLWTS